MSWDCDSQANCGCISCAKGKRACKKVPASEERQVRAALRPAPRGLEELRAAAVSLKLAFEAAAPVTPQRATAEPSIPSAAGSSAVRRVLSWIGF